MAQHISLQADDYIGWLRHGLTQGWVSPPACYFHDGVGFTEAEELQFDMGDDPCVWLIRVYEDDNMRKTLEETHSPYSWRKLEYLHNEEL